MFYRSHFPALVKSTQAVAALRRCITLRYGTVETSSNTLANVAAAPSTVQFTAAPFIEQVRRNRRSS